MRMEVSKILEKIDSHHFANKLCKNKVKSDRAIELQRLQFFALYVVTHERFMVIILDRVGVNLYNT